MNEIKKIFINKAFKLAFPKTENNAFETIRLKGDGSTREWFRIKSTNKNSLIMVDHGPKKEKNIIYEVDSFIAIAKHLLNINIPVPKIHFYDDSYGIVILDDFGDTHLQTVILNIKNQNEIIKYYKLVIDILVHMSVKGSIDFDLNWTYQSTYYDKRLILEKENKYFVNAFLNDYLGKNIDFSELEDEFSSIAKITLENAKPGLMHRDFQSRNIMIYDNKPKIIDFQGARLGPIEYDLASLLIDPYVVLETKIQEELLLYCYSKLNNEIKSVDFFKTYKYCALNRNFQALGAYGYLTRVLNKKNFENYIPPALKSLKENFDKIDVNCPKLKKIINKL